MSTPTFPIETAREFRVLFELCRLSGNRPENSVEMTQLSKTADLASDDFDHSIESLMAAKLAEFDKQVGNLRVTRYGISEIVTAKACPNSRTNYFPSINSMKIRLCRGHHLFDDVEPLWPEELSAPVKSASTNETSKYLPGNKPAKVIRKIARQDEKKTGEITSDLTPDLSRNAIIVQMISELEHLAMQLAGAASVEICASGEARTIKHADQKRPAGATKAATQSTGRTPQPAPRYSHIPKTQSAPTPGSYPSLLFNASSNTASAKKPGTPPVKKLAKEDVTAGMKNPLLGHKPVSEDRVSSGREQTVTVGSDTSSDTATSTGTAVSNAFDQLCNLINTKYPQSASLTDKRSRVRRRQLLKELEAVNESLFSFA